MKNAFTHFALLLSPQVLLRTLLHYSFPLPPLLICCSISHNLCPLSFIFFPVLSSSFFFQPTFGVSLLFSSFHLPVFFFTFVLRLILVHQSRSFFPRFCVPPNIFRSTTVQYIDIQLCKVWQNQGNISSNC